MDILTKIGIKSGALITLLLLLPNFVWMAFPNQAEGDTPKDEPRFLSIAENIGRLLAFVLPFFYALDMNKKFSLPVAVGMGIALLIYYVCWGRYFINGRLSTYLGAPFLGIPLPMAVMPILFFILSAYLMSSWLMFGATMAFGIFHIWVSAMTL